MQKISIYTRLLLTIHCLNPVITGHTLPNINITTLDPTEFGSIYGTSTSYSFGYSLASAGDFNGDGIPDILIGARPATSPGRAYLIYGRKDGFPSINIAQGFDSTQGFIIDGTNNNDALGWSVGRAGDFNGDGLSDIIVGAPYTDPTRAGTVYIIFGYRGPGVNINLLTTSLSANNLGFKVYGTDSNDDIGVSVNYAGDINADGLDDIVIGAFGRNDPATQSLNGNAFVIFGRKTGIADIFIPTGLTNDRGFTMKGAGAYECLGMSVDTAGDVNGDGIADIIVGGHRTYVTARGDPGVAYVVYGRRTGFTDIMMKYGLNTTYGFKIEGATPRDYVGWAVSNAGDINGDGLGDIMVGGYMGDSLGGADAGMGYVIFGKKGGLTDINLANGLNSNQGFKIHGPVPNGFLGFMLKSLGDFNGDGIDDIAISGYVTEGSVNKKTVYIIYGRKTGFSDINLADGLNKTQGATIVGTRAAHQYETSMCNVGDMNGDGINDFAIGDYRKTNPVTSAQGGAVYILPGFAIIDKEVLLKIADAENYATFGTGIAAAVMGMMRFSNISALWLSFMVAILQYVRYLYIDYPPRLKFLLEQPDPEFISIPFISSAPEGLESDMVKYPLTEKFEFYGFHSSFLINFWSSLMVILLIVIAIIIVCVAEYVTRSKKSVHERVVKVKQALKWNYLIAMFTGTFCDIALQTSLEVNTVHFNDPKEWISFIICVIMNVFVLLILIKIALVLRSLNIERKKVTQSGNRRSFEVLKDNLKDYEVIFETFKDDYLLQQGYMFIFTLRLYVFYAIVAHLLEYPIAQAIIFNAIQAVTLIYLVITRPFRDRLDLVSSFGQEIILEIVNVCVLILAINGTGEVDTEDSRVVYGDIIIGCNIAFLAIGVIYLLITTVLFFRDIFRKVRDKYKMKKESQPRAPTIVKLKRDETRPPPPTASVESDTSLLNNSLSITTQELNVTKTSSPQRRPKIARFMNDTLEAQSLQYMGSPDHSMISKQESPTLFYQANPVANGGINGFKLEQFYTSGRSNRFLSGGVGKGDNSELIKKASID